MATKLEGGGGKALVAGPLKNYRFLRLPLLYHVSIVATMACSVAYPFYFVHDHDPT